MNTYTLIHISVSRGRLGEKVTTQHRLPVCPTRIACCWFDSAHHQVGDGCMSAIFLSLPLLLRQCPSTISAKEYQCISLIYQGTMHTTTCKRGISSTTAIELCGKISNKHEPSQHHYTRVHLTRTIATAACSAVYRSARRSADPPQYLGNPLDKQSRASLLHACPSAQAGVGGAQQGLRLQTSHTTTMHFLPLCSKAVRPGKVGSQARVMLGRNARDTVRRRFHGEATHSASDVFHSSTGPLSKIVSIQHALLSVIWRPFLRKTCCLQTKQIANAVICLCKVFETRRTHAACLNMKNTITTIIILKKQDCAGPQDKAEYLT